ncbi:MAG: hypothetical protein HC897_01300 [Thermoanaerobaculia bacterium]|nr:hypothetical protein [Thermoanaerobaculia bacterium]
MLTGLELVPQYDRAGDGTLRDYALLSLGPEGYEIRGAGNSAQLPQLPPTSYQGAQALVLRRQADQPWEDGYSLFASEPVVLLADLRASAHYQRNALENEQCDRCDLPAASTPKQELLSGHQVGVRWSPSLRTALEGLYPDHLLDAAQVEIESVPWDLSPSLRQEPTLNPRSDGVDVVPGTLLHSGEMSLTETDLVLKSRGIDFVFTRTYRSQTLGNGPLGPGWDHGYNLHLRELPNGDVDFFDGRGRRERFRKVSSDFDAPFEAPPGRFATLRRHASGWLLIDQQFNTFHFDAWGRLSAISDPLNDDPLQGTRMSFFYDVHSRLERIQANERSVALSYDANDLLQELRDDTGRVWRYGYDAEGRLEKVTTPAVPIGELQQSTALTTEYAYEPPLEGLAQKLHRRDNLVSAKNGRGVEWLTLTYTDETPGGRHELVSTQTWDGDSVLIGASFAERLMQVRDRRGKYRHYWHGEMGRLVRYRDPASYETSWEYGVYATNGLPEQGLVKSMTMPDGQKMTYRYQYQAASNVSRLPARSLGNLESMTLEPIAGGDLNGAGPQLTTLYGERHPLTHLPVSVTDPRGQSTSIELSPEGLATGTSRQIPSLRPELPEQTIAVASELSEQGLVRSVIGPDGVETHYDYETMGRKKGYLKSVSVDPQQLNLTTRFETDERGNVTRMIDPRGVTHELFYNELDWLVEERHATSAPEGLAAIDERMVYFYDGNGSVVETRHSAGPVGSNAYTRTRYEYGSLDEVTLISREIDPGSDAWLVERRTYDENRNLVLLEETDGKLTSFEYDDRGLVKTKIEGVGAVEAITESYLLDAAGRPTQLTDGRGNVWQTVYDGYGRVKEIVDPNGNKTQRSYDAVGNVVTIVGVSAVGEELSRTELAYDGASRPAITARLLVGPGGENTAVTELSRYDEASRIIERIDPRGVITRFSYDRAGRLLESEDFAGEQTRRFEYDHNGNATRVVDTRHQPGSPKGDYFTTTTSYDALNRPVSIQQGTSGVRELGYDVRGNLVSSTDGESHTTVRTYDGLDRLLSMQRPNGVSEHFSYDAGSRLVRYVDALESETQWSYDVHGRPTSIRYPDSSLQQMSYDASGNLVETTQASGTVVTNSYDAANRLVGRQIVPAPGVEGPNRYQFALNDPVNLSDPMGEYAETAFDATSLALGAGSLAHNLIEENYSAAAFDAIGVVADAVAVATPLLPGGAGVALKASRAAGKLAKLHLIDQTLNIGQGIVQAGAEAQQGNYGWAAFYGGMAALGVRQVEANPYEFRVAPGRVGMNGGNIEVRPKARSRNVVLNSVESGGSDVLRGGGPQQLLSAPGEIDGIPLFSLSNVEARSWYHTKLVEISSKIDPTSSLRDQARHAFDLRNQARGEARLLMSDRQLATDLDYSDPLPAWQQMLKRAASRGLQGADLYRYILDSSRRSRRSVDMALGTRR